MSVSDSLVEFAGDATFVWLERSSIALRARTTCIMKMEVSRSISLWMLVTLPCYLMISILLSLVQFSVLD